jgi:hypothetical protein
MPLKSRLQRGAVCDSIDRWAGDHEDESKILHSADLELWPVPMEIGQRFVKSRRCESHDLRLVARGTRRAARRIRRLFQLEIG